MSGKPLLWKFILIGIIVAVAGFFSYPPDQRINLGLDLRGGQHIMMQVDTESAVKYQLNLTKDRISQRLTEVGLTHETVKVGSDFHSIEVLGTGADKRSEVRKLLDEQLDQWQISAIGSNAFRARMPQEARTFYETSAIDATLDILRTRIDSLGVAEPLIQKQGLQGDRILIQLPGVEDPESVKRIIGDSSVLEWKAVSYPPDVSDFAGWTPPSTPEATTALFPGGQLPPDTELFEQVFDDGSSAGISLWWPLKTVSTVTGSDLRNAYRSTDQWGDAVVNFELTQDAGARFGVATKQNLGRKMAIVLGSSKKKVVISAPVINGVIRDTGVIEGGFTVSSAEELSLKLRSGAIPTDVSIIEERTVGPSLGRDSIRAGLISGLVGFVGVMIFMLIYYRVSGINAVVALALNILLVFGALGALPWLFSTTGGLRATLTLPGIAGLILTIGMAVDSNVLIFERIREELRMGKTVRSAVDQGFGKAFVTILDCNATTLVAAFFLFFYGTGTPAQGFAVTLTIGLMASMFTAVFVSRQLFELVLLRKGKADSISI